jgi:hypothetical protein
MERYQIKQIATEYLDKAFKDYPAFKAIVLNNSFEDFIDKMQGRVHEFKYLAHKRNLKCGAPEIGRFICQMVEARAIYVLEKTK